MTAARKQHSFTHKETVCLSYTLLDQRQNQCQKQKRNQHVLQRMVVDEGHHLFIVPPKSSVISLQSKSPEHFVKNQRFLSMLRNALHF